MESAMDRKTAAVLCAPVLDAINGK